MRTIIAILALTFAGQALAADAAKKDEKKAEKPAEKKTEAKK